MAGCSGIGICLSRLLGIVFWGDHFWTMLGDMLDSCSYSLEVCCEVFQRTVRQSEGLVGIEMLS